MHGLMMQYPLTVPRLFERAATLAPDREIVTRNPDRSLSRTTWREVHRRGQRLANALRRLGVGEGDRVATLGWNHSRHLEAYYAVPAMGAVLHTLNPRLHPSDLAWIVNHAQDRVLLVDEVLLPVLERFRPEVSLRHVIVWSHERVPPGMLDCEALIREELPVLEAPRLDEEQAAGLCYTSGTTGRPKGVLYSHRAVVLHSLASALPDAVGVGMADSLLPIVPMFHVNAWGVPYTAAMVGAKLVLPGPHLDAASVIELLEDERVTVAAGVPTVWLSVLEALDRSPGTHDLSALRSLAVGGSAAPPSMIEGFRERHGIRVLHAWGMTELSPIGTVCRLKPALEERPEAERARLLATQGLPVPLVDVRAVGDAGPVPWDGRSMGELQVRGPWVARAYYEDAAEADKFTIDGWFRTGDVVTIDPEGYVRVTDRSKDLIKSGGEWISSVDLENALMAHPAVREAAVVAVPHPRWGERPAAMVVLRDGAEATPAELRAFLEPRFARFWLPDAFVFAPQIPRNATGKFLKSAVREALRGLRLEVAGEGAGPEPMLGSEGAPGVH